MGRSPSSIYFATTLVLRLKRSHKLSFDRSSSLAKATALLVLGFFPLSTRLLVVKSSLCVYFGTLITPPLDFLVGRMLTGCLMLLNIERTS